MQFYYYHDAEGEPGDDRVLDGDGGEGKSADLTCEDLCDCTEGVLAYGGEDGWGCKVPELLDFSAKLGEEVSNAID